MAVRKEYLEFVLDWLSPLGEITNRPMMGGQILYCDGIVFALIAGNTLYLKVDEATRSRFEALGLEAFRPFPDKPSKMLYFPPPAEFFENLDVLLDWGRQAVAVGGRSQNRKKRPGKRSTSR